MSLSASPLLGASSSSSSSSHSRRLPRGVPAFLHRVLSIAVIQICREAGYERSQSSALDTLCELLHQLIREVGAAAKAGAELANRQRVNAADVLQALDGLQQGVSALMEYRQHSDALPFYHALPLFPTQRPLLKLQPALRPDAASAASLASLHPHIPPFLPALPDEHTYIATPTITKPEQAGSSSIESRKRRAEQSRAAEQSLSRIAQLERQRRSEAMPNGAAAMNGARQEQEDEADDDEDTPARRSVALANPSLHVPVIAPIGSGQKEQERAAAIAKNLFAAPPLPPAPPAPPPPPVEHAAAPPPPPRPHPPSLSAPTSQPGATPVTQTTTADVDAADVVAASSAANADAPAAAAAGTAPPSAALKAEDADVDII